MVYLLFHIEGDPFAIPASRVERVVPFVSLTPLPKAPACVRGMLNYRREAVPVLDVAMILGKVPTQSVLSSRLLLTQSFTAPRSASSKLMALLVPSAVETQSFESEQFISSGIKVADADSLGLVVSYQDRLVQIIEIEKLVPESIKQALIAGQEVVSK